MINQPISKGYFMVSCTQRKTKADYLQEYQKAIASLSEHLAIEATKVDECLAVGNLAEIKSFEANSKTDELSKRVIYLASIIGRCYW